VPSSSVASQAIADTLAAAGLTLESLSASETIRAGGARAVHGRGSKSNPVQHGSAAETLGTAPSGSTDGLALPTMRISTEAAEDPEILLMTRLGKGGMGEVWLGRHRALDREVAVKRLHRDTTDATLAALLEEARITAKLDHGHIVPIHFVARDVSGTPMVVMKRVHGLPWRDLLPREGLHDDALVEQLETLIRVARALEFAHSRDVVHRDVKPENVMVGEYGEVYLVDWGLAVRTGPASGTDTPDSASASTPAAPSIVGTPGFMAPEMLAGDGVDARTDVYLLGATLHRLLTGRMRHEAPTVLEALTAAAMSEPHPYDETVAPELGRIANDACQRDPGERTRSATVFREQLEAYLDRRAAFALLRTADERRDELAHALEVADGDDEAIRALFTQTRFGYQQVLEGWPDLHEAARGHDAAVRLMLDYELGRAQPRAARSLLASLHDPDAATRARVDALEKAERERQSALEAQARDADIHTGGKSRVALSMLFVVGCVSITTAVVAFIGIKVPTPSQLVIIMTGLAAMVLGGLVVFRSRLQGSAHNRHLAVLVIVISLGVLLHRVLGLYNDRLPEITIATDMIMLGMGTGAIGAVSRVALPLTLMFFIAAAWVTAIPAHTMGVFAVAVTLLPVVLAVDWWLRESADGHGDES
jgi:serine/threonine-protein kinase